MTEITIAPPLAKPETERQRSPLYFAWRRFTANKAALGAGMPVSEPTGDLFPEDLLAPGLF